MRSIEAQAGTIEVTSEVGAGTSAHISVAVAVPSAA